MSGDIKITCGTVGKPCKNLDDYPECHPKDEQAGWVGLEEVVACEYEVEAKDGTKQTIQDFRLLVPGKPAPEICKTVRPPNSKDNEETRYTNENEIAALLTEKPGGESDENFLVKMGLKGVCRSPYFGEGGPTSWYAYVDNAGQAGYLTLYNKGAPTIYHDQDGIWLSYEEMMGLAQSEDLNLQKYDFVCSSPPELKKDEDGDRIYSPGRYHFKKDKLFMERIRHVLKDESIEIEGFEGDRREWLVNRLDKVHKENTKDDSRMFWIMLSSGIGAVSGLLVSIYFGEMLYQKVKEKFFGKVKLSNPEEELKAKLEEHPEFDIIGRDREARNFWRKAGKKIGFKNIIINAPTGVGKDVVVEKALLMKIKNDPAVPKQWRDADVVAVDCGEVMKGAELRGKVGQAAIEIVDTMPKKHDGPVIVWLKEADVLLTFGATGGGKRDSAETPGKIFLSYLEKKYQMENVLFAFTTSRGKAMFEEYPDLKRRTNSVVVEEFGTEKIIEIAAGPKKAMYEKLYGIEMAPEAVEQTMRLAEGLYRPDTIGRDGGALGRFPAYDAVLEEAFVIAEEEGLKRIDLDVLVKATGELCNTCWDPKDPIIEEILKMPLEELEARTAMKLQELGKGQFDSVLEAQLRSAMTAMAADAPPLETDDPIIREMDKHPEYKGLQHWEKTERAQAMETLMAELKTYDMLHRFYDEDAKRFLEGKFEIVAKAVEKGGATTTKASLTKAAEIVEKSNPKARQEAKESAAKFAKDAAKK